MTHITKKSNKKSLFVIIALISFPLIFFSKAGYDTFYFMVPAIIAMQLYLCYTLRYMPVFLLLTLYSFIYFIYLIPYFFYDMQLSMWSEFQIKELYIQVCIQFYIFYSALCLSLVKTPNICKRWIKDGLCIKGSPIIQKSVLVITFIIIAYLFKYGGENVLNESNPYVAYQENLGKSNAIGLLVIMFIAFSYFVIQQRRVRTICIITMMLLVALYAITRGFRVIMAPLGFLFILLFLEQRLSVKQIISIALLGLIGLGYLNALKMNEDFSLMYIFSTNEDFILSHQADELYAAAATNGLIDAGIISFWDRIGLQIGLLTQAIIPPSMFPDSMRYPLVIMLHSGTGGGGLVITGLALIFGNVGLFVLTFLLSKTIQFAYISKNRYIKLSVFIILAYSANWFSYDLNVVLRFPIIAIILYYLISNVKIPNLKWQIS